MDESAVVVEGQAEFPETILVQPVSLWLVLDRAPTHRHHRHHRQYISRNRPARLAVVTGAD